MNAALARLVFFGVERLRREPVDRFLRELEDNQKQSAAELQARQAERVRELLAYVGEHNPYYRRKYADWDASDALSARPLLTKPELREHYKALVTPERRAGVSLCKTSGSTGEPLKFYRDREVFGRTLASVFRALAWHGIEVGARYAMLWGIPTGTVPRLKMRARDMVLNRFREREYSLSPAVLSAFHDKVRADRPAYIFGYTSMVYEFAMFVRESGRSMAGVSLNAAVCTAESIPEYQRAVIESVLQCPVVSEYGSAECGIISYQCPQGGHHISSDTVLVETLDPHGASALGGEAGRVVVTVLHSHAAPIIRYELGDYAVRSEQDCACGRPFPLLEQIVGRTSGVIVTPSGRCFHSIVLYYVMKEYADRFGDIRQFKVRQTHVDRLEFHLVTGAAFNDAAQAWLRERLLARLGDGMRVEFFRHEQLERTAAGKLRDFESDLDTSGRTLDAFRGTRAETS